MTWEFIVYVLSASWHGYLLFMDCLHHNIIVHRIWVVCIMTWVFILYIVCIMIRVFTVKQLFASWHRDVYLIGDPCIRLLWTSGRLQTRKFAQKWHVWLQLQLGDWVSNVFLKIKWQYLIHIFYYKLFVLYVFFKTYEVRCW